jgi:glycosyltransferase involved in cell wall biosynthesis
VVTTVDPDDVVRSEGLGLVARGVDELAEAIERVSRRGDEWDDMARRARARYEREHRLDRLLDRYESLLGALTPGAAGTCSR